MEKKCPKCGGEMIEGRIPSPLKYFFGFKSDDQKHWSFETNIQTASACTKCGFVEFYLDPEELSKKLVKRGETVRSQVFRTAVTQDRTQERMLKDRIKKAYDGSVGSLVLQALSSQKSSPGELAEIRHLLNELERGGT